MNMHAGEKSDGVIVPEKRPNKGSTLPAEAVEGRTPPKGNGGQTAAVRTQSRVAASNGLAAVRQAARQSKEVRFTALLHYITVDLLERSYYALKRNSAPGIDGVTWRVYGEDLGAKLTELHARVHRGGYRARPARRSYIPKPDGTKRPLSILCLEDKIIQQAVVFVLEAIFEEDFQGFSYGFRPGRGQHDALDALHAGIYRKRVNWVLDADIQGFFDAMSHKWILRFLRHRIADKRILRLIAKWLKVGITDGNQAVRSSRGTPQGAVISPILANIYLHYAFDLWSHVWRRKKASGDVIIIRYADDIVLGFQYEQEARAFLHDLQVRMRKFELALHPDKTRLISFGRHAAEDRGRQGQRRPETFDFLGFTHFCTRSWITGAFVIGRRTIKKRMLARLQVIKMELRRRWHDPINKTGAWLNKVLTGHLNYFAVPLNARSVAWFFARVRDLWRRRLRRRSQRAYMNWEKMRRLVDQFFPPIRILHPMPCHRFDARTRGRSPVR
ncbi:MAG: group II intron reverse transcriptase/maturase [Verrucomicrobiota bacterium]|jgi:group II intron reverse transcriptase/maturase|nr:group II intron reverse transcriptase/maturase [Verrucomicrobiota bacterium]|tara:strand:+ start:390 stop:1889 length:1500 start_codon:yes stop_codon:yes gene_type:complete